MNFTIKTPQANLIFSIKTKFPFSNEFKIHQSALSFGNILEELVPTPSTQSLLIMTNDTNTLITTSNVGFEGYRVVGRMIKGQETFREMVKKNEFIIQDF